MKCVFAWNKMKMIALICLYFVTFTNELRFIIIMKYKTDSNIIDLANLKQCFMLLNSLCLTPYIIISKENRINEEIKTDTFYSQEKEITNYFYKRKLCIQI